jgi:hypothetical protein
MILKETIAEDLKPLRKGGVTFYPASALEQIFDWAQDSSRQIKWVEGVFYCPSTDEGQLSVWYIHERGDEKYTSFRASCLGLVPEMEAEAATIGMGAYFEIGVSD